MSTKVVRTPRSAKWVVKMTRVRPYRSWVATIVVAGPDAGREQRAVDRRHPDPNAPTSGADSSAATACLEGTDGRVAVAGVEEAVRSPANTSSRASRLGMKKPEALWIGVAVGPPLDRRRRRRGSRRRARRGCRRPRGGVWPAGVVWHVAIPAPPRVPLQAW